MAERQGVAKLLRYAAAAVGPIGSAGAQFALSLVLLHALGQREFGAFSFLLVASQLSWGLWSALFCAPLPILFHATEGVERQAMLRSLFSANLVVALAAAPVFAGLAIALGVPVFAAVTFAVYAAVALLRWFARAHAYASGQPLRTTASDVVYAVTLLAGIGVILLGGARSLDTAYLALLASAVLGLLPFGGGYLVQQFGRFSSHAVAGYWPIWKQHSGWSLLGVLTTEATANSHAYLVTALFGPTAFAPIAASALLIRPIGVAMNALTEFERAQMARDLGGGRIAAALASVGHFRLAMIAVWVGTAILVAVLLRVAPHVIFPPRYPLDFLLAGAALWMAVAGVRLLRQPESTLLQAAGEFRPLALASVYSAGFSVVGVIVLLFSASVLWSIAGILIGEVAYALWIWRQTWRWRRDRVVVADSGEGLAEGIA